MEQALSAILDEAAAQAQREGRLAEEAAQREGGPLGFLEEGEEEEEEDAEQASSGESRGTILCLQLVVFWSLNNSCKEATHGQQPEMAASAEASHSFTSTQHNGGA